jgi:glycosyltransferase involved in cell wall biosynthesis
MNEMDTWGHGQADVVVVSADAYRRTLISNGVDPRRLVSIAWGLAPHTITAARRVPRHPVIGFVGRVERRKRQADLVEAFSVVHAAHPEARLELVGPVADPDYAAEIRGLVARHGLERVVRWRGLVPSVPRVVARWTLFASLSADEGQGLAVLEAMALGVPVAAVPCAGVEDYVEGGTNAVALDGASPRAIGVELLTALGEPAMLERIARGGQRTATTRFGWNATVDRFESLYRKGRPRRHRDGLDGREHGRRDAVNGLSVR